MKNFHKKDNILILFWYTFTEGFAKNRRVWWSSKKNFRIILKRENTNSWTEALFMIFPQNRWFLANVRPVSVKFIQPPSCYFLLFGKVILCKSAGNMNVCKKSNISKQCFFSKRKYFINKNFENSIDDGSMVLTTTTSEEERRTILRHIIVVVCFCSIRDCMRMRQDLTHLDSG